MVCFPFLCVLYYCTLYFFFNPIIPLHPPTLKLNIVTPFNSHPESKRVCYNRIWNYVHSKKVNMGAIVSGYDMAKDQTNNLPHSVRGLYHWAVWALNLSYDLKCATHKRPLCSIGISVYIQYAVCLHLWKTGLRRIQECFSESSRARSKQNNFINTFSMLSERF